MSQFLPSFVQSFRIDFLTILWVNQVDRSCGEKPNQIRNVVYGDETLLIGECEQRDAETAIIF